MYGADVTFVGVAGRDDLDPIVDFIEEYGVDDFSHIIDETGEIWQNFRIVSQPSFIFLDANGESETHLGALGVDGLTERLDRLTAN
jgi:hypothetical protein